MGMAGERVEGREGGRAATMFWIALWLAVALVIAKACAPKESFEVVAQTRDEFVHNLAVLVHQDLMYAAAVPVCASLSWMTSGARPGSSARMAAGIAAPKKS